MVTDDGVVKLLDFGIAKIVAEDAELDITETDTGLHLMTPEFASPEQVKSGQITTATDIYSLGLILCKLLTGQMPYDVKKKTPLEISKIITEIEPAKPSTLITSYSINNEFTDGRKIDLSGLKKTVEGDLDNIILMALRKDPSRRYQSVDQFLQDIRNYRNDRPVLARGESGFYHFSKMVKRHRVVVASAVMVVIVSLAAGLISLQNARAADEQKKIAESRLADLRSLTGSLMFDVYDSISELPGSTSSLELIVDKTEWFLDMLSEIDAQEPEALLELSSSYRRVGDLAGNPTGRNLGRPSEALQIYDKSYQIVNKLPADYPDTRKALQVKIDILESKADVLVSIGRLEEASQKYGEAQGLYDNLNDRYPDQGYDFNKAVVMLKHGDMMGNQYFTNKNLPDSALTIYHMASEVISRHHEREPANIRVLRYSGLIEERKGAIYEQIEKYDDSFRHYTRSMELRKQYAELQPLNVNAIRDMGVAYEKVAKGYHLAGNLDSAKLNFDHAFDIYQRLARQDSTNAMAVQTLAIAHIHQGDLSYHSENLSYNDIDGAVNHFNNSKQLLEKLHSADSVNAMTNHLLNLVNRRLQHISELKRN